MVSITRDPVTARGSSEAMAKISTVGINKRFYKISTLHAVLDETDGAGRSGGGVESTIIRKALCVPAPPMARLSLRCMFPAGENRPLTEAAKALHLKMRNWFRDVFYAGAGLAVVLGIYLMWLWGAEHQVRLHSDHLFRAMQSKSWLKFDSFVSDDYHDQWGQDHALVAERTREVFRYFRSLRIAPGYAIVRAGDGRASWQAKITIEGDDNELAALVKDRVNLLTTPFTLEWRRVSGKPWDWKLVRVGNPALELPTRFE